MRLELTRRTDLALRALRSLGRSGTRMQARELATGIGTSTDFLSQVMNPLVRSGWVDSVSGRHGGYLLKAGLQSVTVLEVIEAVEGIPDSTRCVLRDGVCDSTERCALHEAWSGAREALLAELANTPVRSNNRRQKP